MANLESLSLVSSEPTDMLSFISGADSYFVNIEKEINLEEELDRLNAELERNQKLLASTEKKLSNERFVANAPEQVITNERKKQTDAQQRIEIIKKEISNLS